MWTEGRACLSVSRVHKVTKSEKAYSIWRYGLEFTVAGGWPVWACEIQQRPYEPYEWLCISHQGIRCYLYKCCTCGGEGAGTERILIEEDGWIC